MGMMYGASSRLMGFACDARDRACETIEAQPGASPGDAAVAVIMSVVAAECFLNELGESVCTFDCMRDNEPPDSPAGELTSLYRLLDQVEKERGGLLLKFHLAAQALSGRTFDPGKNPFQDFQALVSVRNLLVHFRPNDNFQYDEQGRVTGNKHPRLVQQLQQRGLARRPKTDTIEEWSSTLMTGELAVWACKTALEQVYAVISLLPPSGTKMFFNSWVTMREHQSTS